MSCRQAWRGDLGAPSGILIGLSNATGFTFAVRGDLGCDAPACQRMGAIDFDGDGKDDCYGLSGGGTATACVGRRAGLREACAAARGTRGAVGAFHGCGGRATGSAQPAVGHEEA